MADAELSSPLAPVAVSPERTGTVFEAKIAPNAPGGRGPLRFEEGIATDTDVPDEFTVGLSQGYVTAPGRPNHNQPVFIKTAEEVIRERMHMGSAAWTSAPSFLQGFSEGAGPEAEQKYVAVDRTGGSYLRRNPSTVID
jgi:hypothetical protein